jgi:hypothetical protein
MTQRAIAPTPSTFEQVIRFLVRALDAHHGVKVYVSIRPDLAHAIAAARAVLDGRDLVTMACMHDGCSWAGMFELSQPFRCANCGDSRGVPIGTDDAARRTRAQHEPAHVETIELGTHGVCPVCLHDLPRAELDEHVRACRRAHAAAARLNPGDVL